MSCSQYYEFVPRSVQCFELKAFAYGLCRPCKSTNLQCRLDYWEHPPGPPGLLELEEIATRKHFNVNVSYNPRSSSGVCKVLHKRRRA